MPEDIEMRRMEDGRLPPRRRDTNYEEEETDYRPVNWKKLLFSWKYLPWHILAIAIGVATILITIHHDEVVAKLRPWSEKVRDLPAGWLIPIAILIIISFPPLFGHEIIALLCGVVYGLWIGFGIVAAGTFIGEVGTWFAFKYALRRRAARLERTNLNYGALARMTRDGGFWVVLIIRFSAIPAHFSTAVFSTCDVNFWFFVIATFLSLPKQIFLVYLGVLLVQEKNKDSIEAVMFVIVFIVTVAMAVWIWLKMSKVKKVLLEEQAERKAARRKDQEMENGDWTAVVGESSNKPDSMREFGTVEAGQEYEASEPRRALPPSDPRGEEFTPLSPSRHYAPPPMDGRPF